MRPKRPELRNRSTGAQPKPPVPRTSRRHPAIAKGCGPCVLEVRNHQRAHKLDTALLGRILKTFLEEILGRPNFILEFNIVTAAQIIKLNRQYVRHEGVTDVISFDYSAPEAPGLRGEIFVCLEEARRQARRFRTTWQRELVRYCVHGVLHLCGHDDRTPSARRKMKRAEDCAMRALVRELRDFSR